MTILFKISAILSTQQLNKCLEEIADMRAALIKKYPDVVVNVEVEIR